MSSRAWAIAAAAILATNLGPATSGQAVAKRLHLHLDPAATTVQFTLKDTLHTVRGSFHLDSGDIYFDPQTGHAQGKIEVGLGRERQQLA